ncbi:MAG: efflux RND transporter periplasmic adaptor subunit [Muribaculaceae bacterium]|nr:efflux RND transporter periplasmic adaptor subunit [Muribaculaceae bacterium]
MNYRYILFLSACALLSSCDGEKHVHSAECSHSEETHNTEQPGHEDKHSDEEHSEIVFSPEKAKKYGVTTEKIVPTVFNNIIKVSGDIISAQGDSYVVTAPTSGNIKYNKNIALGMAVKSGASICAISGEKITGGDQNEIARVTYNATKRELERLTPLYKDKIVTEREYNIAREAFEKAELAFRPSTGGRNVASSAISGTITELLLKDGEYVEAGAPIATVSKNARLTLRADLPERYYSELANINTANIKTSYMDIAIPLSELNGKRLSSMQPISNNGYIPLYFEFNNNNKFIAGTYTEVYLVGAPKQNVIIVPLQAVLESEGKYQVYIRLDEECYEERDVILGSSDGKNFEIKSGIKSGEEIVVNGASYIKLASKSEAIPSGCSHNH